MSGSSIEARYRLDARLLPKTFKNQLKKLACKVPKFQATVVDLPDIVPLACGFVEEAGMADRIDVQAKDLTRESPEGSYDLAVLRNFLQVLSAEHCRAVLKHVGEALEPGGAIQILGHMLDDSRLAPAHSLSMNFPGTGGTVPPMLGIWSIFFCWLVAAAVASQMGSDVNHEVG